MGREARVAGRFGGRSGEVKLHLDSEMLAVSGAFRLKLPLAGLAGFSVAGEWLTVETPEGPLELALGAAAERWAAAMASPPGLARKLGLKAGQRVLLLGEMPPQVLEAAADAGVQVLHRGSLRDAPRLPADLLFLAPRPGALAAELEAAASRLDDGTALWLVFRKGLPGEGETAAIAAGRAAGLKDVKVAKVSASHAALRFSRPRG